MFSFLLKVVSAVVVVVSFSKFSSTSVGPLIRECGPVRYLTPVVRGWFEKSRKVGGLEMNSLPMNVKWCVLCTSVCTK